MQVTIGGRQSLVFHLARDRGQAAEDQLGRVTGRLRNRLHSSGGGVGGDGGGGGGGGGVVVGGHDPVVSVVCCTSGRGWILLC